MGKQTITKPTLGPSRVTSSSGHYVTQETLDYRSPERKRREAAEKRAETSRKKKASGDLVNALQSDTTGQRHTNPASGSFANYLGRMLVRILLRGFR